MIDMGNDAKITDIFHEASVTFAPPYAFSCEIT